jgi:hypothetical protein
MSHATPRRSAHSHGEPPILGLSTILILSGILIGMVTGHAIEGDLRPYVQCVGLCGLIAYVGLYQADQRRRASHERAEQANVEGRLERHVGHCVACDAVAIAARESALLRELLRESEKLRGLREAPQLSAAG